MTTNSFKFKKGQLLVEVLVGIGIMAILVSAILPLMLTSTNASIRENKNSIAISLAKEQIEATKAVKEENWNNLYSVTKGADYYPEIDINTGKWKLTSGVETIPLNGLTFQRSIKVDNVSRTDLNGTGNIESTYQQSRDDPSTQKVTSTVTSEQMAAISITEYMSHWKSSLWTETDWSAGQYSSINNIDATTVVGALQLARISGGAAGNYGNRFLLTATGTIGRLNNQTKRADMRFTAQKTGAVNQVRVYLNNANNSGSTFYRYGIQADNSGLPSGVYLEAGLASGIAAFSTTGWQTVNLSSNANLTVGTVYHLVVQYNSGTTPNNTRYIDIRNSSPQNQLVPLTQIADNQQNTLFFTASWAIQNREPLYVLGFNDGTYEGNPYDTSEQRSVYGNIYEGEYFSITSDKTISALNLYLSKNANQNPTAPLKIVLRNLTTGADLFTDETISGINLTTAYQWKTINLPANITLPANNQFRLYLSSFGSAPNRYYRIYNISNPNNAEYNNINWDGVTSKVSRSADGGLTWDDTNDFIDMSGYYFTTVESSSYAPSGDLVSTTLDALAPAGFNRILWPDSDVPLGTTIRFQLAANNNDSTWVFRGPQGTTTDYYTAKTGENILSNPPNSLSNNRYLRYKVFLETSNPSLTPILREVKINWSP